MASYLFFFAVFAGLLALLHLPLLHLPLYWDEMGQFVPAALDLYRHGLWVPRSTVPNVHPPGLMAYLALVWHAAGYSIPATRVAMLLLSAGCLLAAFLLAIRLCRSVPGAPALTAVLLLAISPLFYTQAMLAQLDLPATLFTLWALLLFLEDRIAAAALASTVLVLVKETGVAAPLVFAGWLWLERKRRRALWFLLPAAALAAWLIVLWRATGYPLGNAQFTNYNLLFPLHPVRVALALLRRAFYLFAEDFHWIGWVAVALAWRRTDVFRSRGWGVAATFALVQVLLVTLLGGATLERYLLPVLPLVYTAFAAGFSASRSRWSAAARAALFAGLLLCLFFNPPYPYPFENNLAMVDFVRLQQSAAEFVEQNYPSQVITTAWPLASALRRPDFGYVSRPLKVKEVPGFGASDLAPLSSVEVFVLYSKEWEREWDLRRLRPVRWLLRRQYGYQPQVQPQELERRFHLSLAARWAERGQWAAVYVRASGVGPGVSPGTFPTPRP